MLGRDGVPVGGGGGGGGGGTVPVGSGGGGTQPCPALSRTVLPLREEAASKASSAGSQ